MIEHEEPTEEAIRKRAYEISQRANGGSPEENWRLAREELRDEAWSAAREAERSQRSSRASGEQPWVEVNPRSSVES